MSRYGSRIAALARQAERDRAAVELADADTEAAREYLREGAGQAIWWYVEARTGERPVAFSTAEFAAIERAMNDWLECYTRCYGVELEADFTVRQAAELLLETRNVVDTAQLLTGVPERRRRTAGADQ
ncbi:hypothetical protein [Natronococcus occultus]|uniref:DUF8055 domain-containing protein n=1 Tax=Natronococcus occultus SP4 TaxID=694430 RepID=L0JYM7_9EURY|nr:hypothetical protein [Natronococcus occultus]AGB37214.1 hypothetical protein Natoc_1402 [Natronococcus occultus SP4]